MFCKKCGAEIADDAVFCAKCGTLVADGSSGNVNQAFQPQQTENLLAKLAEKIKIECYIWLGVAVVQVILGIVLLLEWGEESLALFVVAALNIYGAYTDYKYSQKILTDPSGIVKKYEPLTGLVIQLAYNLIFGGVIGVAGTAFGFFTRDFVMKNRQGFEALERARETEGQ